MTSYLALLNTSNSIFASITDDESSDKYTRVNDVGAKYNHNGFILCYGYICLIFYFNECSVQTSNAVKHAANPVPVTQQSFFVPLAQFNCGVF